MKKRSILVTVLAVVLACVISVGGTFAYLTAKDTEITNTFHFADNMTVDITEPTPSKTGNETISGDPEEGFDYDNVVPNQTLDKKPTIYATTDVNSYVFVKISGASSNVWPEAITAGWNVLKGGDKDNNYYNGVYYKEIDVDTMKKNNDGKYELGTIFTKVQVGDPAQAGTTVVDLGSIVISVYEIQKGSFADADAAFNATDTAFQDTSFLVPTT